MLKVGDRAIVMTDNGGHFYKGKHVIVLDVLSDRFEEPIRVKAENGQVEGWYSENDLQKVED